MNLQTVSTSITPENAPNGIIWSLLDGHFISGGFDSQECEAVSGDGFKVLMVLVVVAAFAFGCIVNGWLL